MGGSFYFFMDLCPGSYTVLRLGSYRVMLKRIGEFGIIIYGLEL